MPDGKRSPTRMIGDYLREKSVLLILDNCEHVLDPVAIGQRCSGCANWYSARRRRSSYTFDDEQIIHLQPFPPEVGDSKTLLHRRTRSGSIRSSSLCTVPHNPC